MQTAAQFGPLESGRAEVFSDAEQLEREVVFALEQVGDNPFLIMAACFRSALRVVSKAEWGWFAFRTWRRL